MQKNSIYLVSTVLHLYTASAIALQRTNESAHLFIIDQPETTEFPVLPAYQAWQSSPFKSTHQFFGRYKKLRDKLKSRKENFKKIESLISNLKPQNIFVGNDRRVEFQYSMACCQKHGINCVGHYMDEGIFSYNGRKASSSWGDKYFDNAIKKCIYGYWWKNPPTVGGSTWISEVHLAFPKLAHQLLVGKTISKIDNRYFKSDSLLELSSNILKQNNINKETVAHIDALITLPHESIFEKDKAYCEKITLLIENLKAKDISVAIKYHPRNSHPDILGLSKQSNVTILPSAAVMEALLTILPEKTTIIGDMSSTMLITRWLRDDMPVYYLRDGDSGLISILSKVGVQPVTRLFDL